MSGRPAPALTARALSCAVGGRVVLRGVDLDLAPGTTTAVLGVNGSGKTTLLRTLAGLQRPETGAVLVGDREVHDLPARRRAQVVAFVAQEESPPADMTAGEFVALGRLPHHRPWARGDGDRPHARAALAEVGLDAALDRPCAQLSGGERRRVCLARGLVQDCELLVLDEPTNHLDVSHQVALLALLRASGRTVLTALHDLALAAAYADQVVVLHEGRVHAAGAPHDVLTPDVVTRVFGVDAAHLSDPRGRHHLVVGPGRHLR